MRLQGKVSVVTGGGRGIGREIALQQAREGARVALIARTATEIERVAAEIGQAGGIGIALALDLTDGAAVDVALAAIQAELGEIDCLVNNHGSFAAIGPIWDVDPDVWWRDVEINLRGTFLTCRSLAKAMRDRGHGQIVNLVGGGTGTSFPHGSGYASSKAAIMRFTECLNDTLRDAGAYAFAVDPGLVRTSMTLYQLQSEAGRAYLPGMQGLFDQGVNIEPSRAAMLIADIAAGRFDGLNGRLLCGVDDRDLLEAEMERIAADDLRSLRIQGMKLD